MTMKMLLRMNFLKWIRRSPVKVALITKITLPPLLPVSNQESTKEI